MSEKKKKKPPIDNYNQSVQDPKIDNEPIGELGTKKREL